MDFLSRDQQRRAVEEMAPTSGDAQVRVALKAIETARQAATEGSADDRAAHVGYHLVHIHLVYAAQPFASRAGAIWRVERKGIG